MLHHRLHCTLLSDISVKMQLMAQLFSSAGLLQCCLTSDKLTQATEAAARWQGLDAGPLQRLYYQMQGSLQLCGILLPQLRSQVAAEAIKAEMQVSPQGFTAGQYCCNAPGS